MIDDDFVKMIKQLQKKIEYEEEKIYSKIVINEYRNPTYFGVIKNPDAIGKIKGPCGDTVKFSLKIKNEVITNANFWTDGCGTTLASGNMLIKIIMGKKIQDANKITAKDLVDALGGLPKENHHCAVLAINTLQKSIRNYQNKK